jgi:hypothetical protein
VTPRTATRQLEPLGFLGTRRKALPREPADEIVEESILAAVQMRHASDIDPHAVRGIGGSHGRVAEAPARQFGQARLVLVRSCLEDVQLRHERLRVRDRHPRPQAETVGGYISQRDEAARSDAARRGNSDL